MNEFLITFRECLEASLIVGIIFTVLDKNNLHNQKRALWTSVIAAVIASALLGVILYDILEQAGEGVQALLEGIFMYITAGLLFYVIFWMSKSLTSRQAISDQTTSANEKGKWGIFLLVFFAILREGFETALFLVASTNIDSEFSLLGFFSGIVIAVLIGYLIVVQGKKIQLRLFFKYTSLLLVFFAAGMIAYGTHELHEYLEEREHHENHEIASTPETISSTVELTEAEKELIEKKEKEEYVYNIFTSKTAEDNPSKFWYKENDEGSRIHILNDNGLVGSFFKGLFGYNSNPILIEVILWFLALLFGLFIWRRAYKVNVKI